MTSPYRDRDIPLQGCCTFMVSDSISRVVGKRCCMRLAVLNGLCRFHQPEAVKARYDKLLARHR